MQCWGAGDVPTVPSLVKKPLNAQLCSSLLSVMIKDS